MHEDRDTPFPEAFRGAIRQFKEAWHAGRPRDVREFVASFDDPALQLFRELIVIDFYERRRPGGRDPVEVYLTRYPEVADDQRVVAALVAVEALTTRRKPDREDYLERFPRFREPIDRLFRDSGGLIPEIGWGWTSCLGLAVPGAPDMANDEAHPAPPPPTPPLSPNHTLSLCDEYEITREIGCGGYKTVYEARQRSSQGKVAVKVLRRSAALAGKGNDGHLRKDAEQLMSEGRIQALLDHQDVPPVFMLGPDHSAPTVLVEKLIEGGNAWRPNRPFTRHDLSTLIRVARALASAHEKGIIHRDIKPQNVVIRGTEVYVIDWGMALSVKDGNQEGDGTTGPILPGRERARGAFAGTSAYAPPEMVISRVEWLSPASDVYLLGGILYEVLTGTPPFWHERVEEVYDLQYQLSGCSFLKLLSDTVFDRSPFDRGYDLADFVKYLTVETAVERATRLKREWVVRYDLQLMSWRDGSGVPTSGNNLVIIGTNTAGLLHIRVFDDGGTRTDSDETKLPPDKVGAISALKQQLSGLLPPYILTAAEKAQVLQEISSILGQTWAVPEELSRIAEKAMEIDPEDRYSDAGRFADAIDDFIAHADAEQRCLEADARLARVQEMLKKRGRVPASVVTALIGIADQYHQARQVWHPGAPAEVPLRIPSQNAPDDASYRHACRGEIDARTSLFHAAMRAGDFNLADAHLTLIAEVPGVDSGRLADDRARLARSRGVRRSISAAAITFAILTIGGFLLAQKNADDRRRADENTARAESAKAALPWIQEAAVGRAQGNAQKQALALAEAMRIDPASASLMRIRADQIDALQHSLSPVVTSSRRVPTMSLLYTPDGHLVSADGQTAVLRIWRDGEQEFALRGHTVPENTGGPWPPVWGLAVAPEHPNVLISAGLDGTLRGWNLLSGEPAWTFRTTPAPPSGQAPAVMFTALAATGSPGGDTRLVTGEAKGRVAWWTLRRGDKVEAGRSYDAHKGAVFAVRGRPGGRGFASAGEDGRVALWTAEAEPAGVLDPKRLDPDGTPTRALDIAFHPDGRRLAVGGSDGIVRIWDVDQKTLAHELKGHEAGDGGMNRVRRVAFTPDGVLLSGGADGVVRAWDVDAGRQRPTSSVHAPSILGPLLVTALAIRPDGRQFASAGSDASLHIWEAPSGKAVARLEGLCTREGIMTDFIAAAMSRHAGGDLLLAAGFSGDAFIRAFDAKSLRERRIFARKSSSPQDDLPSALAASPDGTRFVAATLNGHLEFWAIDEPKGPVQRVKAHQLPDLVAQAQELGGLPKLAIATVAWSRDGKLVASAGVDLKVKLWEPGREEPLVEWDATDPETQYESPIPELRPGPALLAFTGDGEQLVTAGPAESVIRIRDRKTGAIVRRLPGYAKGVVSLSMSPDTRWMATGGFDGSIDIWETQNFTRLRTVILQPIIQGDPASPWVRRKGPAISESAEKMKRTGIFGLAFSSNAGLLAASQGDGSISLIDVMSGQPIHRGLGHESYPRPFVQNEVFFTSDDALLTAGGDATVRRWDLLPEAKSIRNLDDDSIIRRAAASPDGSEWAVVHWSLTEPKVARWDALTGHRLGQWSSEAGNPPTCAAYSPKGDKLFVGLYLGGGVVLDRATNKVIATLREPAGRSAPRIPWRVTTIAVDPAGEFVATNWEDSTIDVWRLVDGSHVRTIRRDDDKSSSPDVGPLGERFKQLLPDNVVKLSASRACSLAFRPKHPGQLAASYADGALIVWDITANKAILLRADGPKQTDTFAGLAFPPGDGRILAHAGYGQECVIWDLDAPSGPEARIRFRGHDEVSLNSNTNSAMVADMVFGPGGEWLATCGSDGAVRFWDGKTGEPIAVVSTLRLASYRSPFNMRTEADPVSKLPWLPPTVGVRFLSLAGDKLLFRGGAPPLHWVDVNTILAQARRTPAEVLDEAQRLTGLRRFGDEFAPAQILRFVPSNTPSLP